MLNDEDLVSSSRGRKLNKQVAVCDCNKGKPIDPGAPLVPFITKVDKEGYCLYCKHYAFKRELMGTEQINPRKSNFLKPHEIEQVKELLAAKMPQLKIAKKFKVGQATIARLAKKLREGK